MQIINNPDDYKSIVTHHTCNHHKKNPKDLDYAGCTCGSSYTLVKK